MDRTRNIGKISAKDAINMSLTGPVLRGSGVAYDVRKAQPYSGYEQYDFMIPTGTHGDVYDRYLVRVEEMRQSLRIIQQALDKLPYGPVRINNRKYVPPPGLSWVPAWKLSSTTSNYGRRVLLFRRALCTCQLSRLRGELGVLP